MLSRVDEAQTIQPLMPVGAYRDGSSLNRQRLAVIRKLLRDLRVVELHSTHDILVSAPTDAAHAVARWLVDTAALRA
jgi:hypothetical protein